jgi:hypothetical protein
MAAEFTGRCACGAIRYEVTAEPIVMFNCHCRDCQRTTGGGSPKYYDTASEMVGENQREFCPEAKISAATLREIQKSGRLTDRASVATIVQDGIDWIHLLARWRDVARIS